MNAQLAVFGAISGPALSQSQEHILNPAKPMFPPLPYRKLFVLACAVMLAACSSQPVKDVENAPLPPPPPPAAPRKPLAKVTPPPKPLTGLALVNSLLPPKLADRSGWAADIFAAFEAIKIAPTRETVCAVIAEIEQESSFQAAPGVPGLGKIVRHELDIRRQRYHIPQWLMDNRLDMRSPNGKTYNERIDALKTENDVNALYNDMISEVPFGKDLLADYNPVRTCGPMQVSMTFAHSYTASKPYPYGIRGALRDELFTRKGGIYFGVAYLLDYPANYNDMAFRFADFNAGIYSSRNAALQNAVSSLSGILLRRDGDLLRYKDGVALEDSSQTMQALLSISSRLKMDKGGILHDLLLEKSPAFEQSRLYKRLFALAPAMPKAYIPEIVLTSPKFSRKLSTADYARQVDRRYQLCLKK